MLIAAFTFMIMALHARLAKSASGKGQLESNLFNPVNI
jgi:hypothetical protein